MGNTDYGTQIRSIGFFDPANSGIVNKRNLNVQEQGIYRGGYIIVTNTTQATLSPLVCIIGDGTYQLRIETTVPITLSGFDSITSRKYVILRWLHTTNDATNEYMDVLVVTAAQIAVNDLIVGVATFSGSDLIVGDTFNYGDATYPRSEAAVPQLLGKIEALETPSMFLRVRGVNANYGVSNLRVYNHRCTDATSPASFPIPTAVSATRIDLIYLDTNGVVKRFGGVEGGSAPAYQNKIALAEVTVGVGVSTITQDKIKDVRPFTTGSTTTVNGSQLLNLSGITPGAGVIPSANLPTGSWTTIPALAGNALKYLRVNAAGTAIEFVPPTYS